MKLQLESRQREELVLKNERLVYHIVQKMLISSSNYEDVSSVGKIGLIKAAQTFDESKEIKFSTYASRCIQNEILMYFRKEKNHLKNISLSEPIGHDGEGNEITLMDKIPESTIDFTEQITQRESFINIINIILNVLELREKLVILYKLSGFTQKEIADKLGISQSYISRIQKKIKDKIKKHLKTIDKKDIKYPFCMEIENDVYNINFYSAEAEKVFYKLKRKITKIDKSKIFYYENRVMIQIPADIQEFVLIAEMVKEIEYLTIKQTRKDK